VQHTIKIALGAALLLAAGGMLVKAWVTRNQRADGPAEPIEIRPIPTLLVGVGGGIIVGLTSVCSGSLIIVALLALYPKLRANDLVGTDLVQAIPLVISAAVGHALFGDLRLDIAGAVLLGSIPGVLLGARISSRAPGGIVRAALVIVLLASSLKLLDVPTLAVGLITGTAILVAIGVAVVRRARGRAGETPRLPAEDDREPSMTAR
jgi:uncharacterized membrane protein YfcA